jgi:alpha-1,2-mannosyltransferase
MVARGLPVAGAMSRLRRRIRRWSLVSALAFATVFVLNLTPSGVVGLNGHLKGQDYVHFYVLGRLAVDGDASLLYDTQGQADYLRAAVPGADLTYFVPVYGPQVALAFAPFAWFPYLASLALWLVTTLIAYALCCMAALRFVPTLKPFRTELILLALASPALWQLLIHGQNSAIGLASYTIGWLCLRSGKRVLAGIVFGLLFYKPQLAVALCGVLLLTGGWKVLSGMALSASLQLTVAAAYFGQTALVEYVDMLRRLSALTALIEPKLHLMHSFKAFFQIVPGLAPVAVAGSLVCSAWLVFALARRWATKLDPDLCFVLILPAAILISPHTSVYDLVILTPALIVIADRLLALQGRARRTELATCWTLLALVYLLPAWSTASLWLHIQPLVPCLAALVVCVARLPQASYEELTDLRIDGLTNSAA